jgi:hypothetical protein
MEQKGETGEGRMPQRNFDFFKSERFQGCSTRGVKEHSWSFFSVRGNENDV